MNPVNIEMKSEPNKGGIELIVNRVTGIKNTPGVDSHSSACGFSQSMIRWWYTILITAPGISKITITLTIMIYRILVNTFDRDLTSILHILHLPLSLLA